MHSLTALASPGAALESIVGPQTGSELDQHKIVSDQPSGLATTITPSMKLILIMCG